MANDTEMKPLSELELFNTSLDANSLVPMTVNQSGSNITRKVYFPALKIAIAGYELKGVLTAGSTSITLSSVGLSYNDQNAYVAGDKVTHTDSDEVTRNYICFQSCSAANWETNRRYFVEYPLVDSDSNIRVSTTKFGLNPTDVSVSNSAVTLTFAEQSEDIGVKVRIY